MNTDSNAYWESNSGSIKITDMRTSHLINTIKLINRMYVEGSKDEYPEQYDNLYLELNKRGVDTDLELDSYYPGLED